VYAVLCSTFTIKANAQQYKFQTVSSKWLVNRNNKIEGVAKGQQAQQPACTQYMPCNGTAPPARVLQPVYLV
jgi:hypothetical protein